MPTVTQFDPYSYNAVMASVNNKNRNSRKHDKAIDQEWFRWVFPQQNTVITVKSKII